MPYLYDHVGSSPALLVSIIIPVYYRWVEQELTEYTDKVPRTDNSVTMAQGIIKPSIIV